MTTKRRASKPQIDDDADIVKDPMPSDVLFGRGGHINHNPANQRYLNLVSEMKATYNKAKRTEKADVAWDIIRQLREQDPRTRFMRKDYSTGLWHVVDDAEVRRKISQCLRERGVPVCASSKPGKRSKEAKKLQSSMRKRAKTSTEEDSESQKETNAPPLPVRATPTRRVSWQGKQLWANTSELSSTATSLGAQGGLLDLNMGAPVEKLVVEQTLVFPDLLEVVGTKTKKASPPPMPAPAPIRKEGSSRMWSDFLTGSFASFAPSVFDVSSGVENSWENLMDSSALPQLEREDDESHSSEEHTIDRNHLGFGSNVGPVGWVESLSQTRAQTIQSDGDVLAV